MRRLPALAFAALAPVTLACGDEDAPATPDPTDVVVRFAARAGDDPIACGQTYAGMGTGVGPIAVRDFRLYVSDLRLVAPDGTERPLALEADGIWQRDGVALLDFEDGTASCSETGNPELNTTVRGATELAEVSGIRFRLGLPFELNHFDTATQASPLNLPSMFWNWRGGYKFIRIDVRDEGSTPPNPFNIHLGSTACGDGPAVTPPTAPCGRPNLADVALDGFDPATDEIVLDLAGLLEGVDTSTNAEGTPPGCMSAPTDPTDCAPVFRNLGLSFASGACEADCAGQRFVRVQ